MRKIENRKLRNKIEFAFGEAMPFLIVAVFLILFYSKI
jgi:hypothetical protein